MSVEIENAYVDDYKDKKLIVPCSDDPL